MGKVLDLTGQMFGRLKAIRIIKIVPTRGAVWECRCRCGKTAEVLAVLLRNGGVQSCGCKRKLTYAGRGWPIRRKHEAKDTGK